MAQVLVTGFHRYICNYTSDLPLAAELDICGICRTDFDHADDSIITTHCGHTYHLTAVCLLRWLPENDDCPMCRRVLFEEDEDDWNLTNATFYASLPDIVLSLDLPEHLINRLEGANYLLGVDDSALVFGILGQCVHLTTTQHRKWGPKLVPYDDFQSLYVSVTFTDEMIAYHITAKFTERLASRADPELWLKLEHTCQQRCQAHKYRPLTSRETVRTAMIEMWFLRTTLPADTDYSMSLSKIFGMQSDLPVSIFNSMA
jgi:hypothetical protein